MPQRSFKRRAAWLKAIARTLLFMVLFSSFRIVRADDLDNLIFAGVVRDSANAVIVAARVTAKHTATWVERSVLTDSQGRYRLTFTEPGIYEVTVNAAGFKAEERKAIEASSGRNITLDFALVPETINEQITVSPASAPLVDTSRTVVGGTFERRDLEALPILNRNPLQLIFLLGGATEAPLSTAELADEGRGQFVRNAPEEAGLFSLTGAPATSNNLTIDGLDNNDDRGARERITLSPEAIAEVQIISNQYAAEYGRAAGSRINVRTRSGANQYRGAAYFYFGDEALNANTYFRNARGLSRIPQSEYREGGTFSGPLSKQKLFFFASFERLNVTDFAEINTLVPVQTNPLFPLPQPNQPLATGSHVGLLFTAISTPEIVNTANLRGDVYVNELHNATARFDLSRGANQRGFGGGARLAETILLAGRNSDSISFTDNYIFTPRFLNQARLQYSRLLPRSKTAVDSIGVEIDEPAKIIAGAFTGSASAPAFARQERRTQIQDTLSFTGGTHFFKAGFDAQLLRSTFDNLFAANGQYRFASVDDFLANRPSRFVQRFNTASRVQNNVTGIFIQDEWKLKNHLTLSLGLRWDNETILRDRDNFSPRLAIAFDPFGGKQKSQGLAQSGKTVIRAGFGIFYNRALLRTLDDFSLGRTSITVDSDLSPAVLALVKFPNSVTDANLAPTYGVKETGFLRRVSKDLQIPYTVQSGLGIERQVSKNLVITADYIFTRGAHLWREANINAPLLPAGFASFTDYLMSRDFDNRPVQGARPIASSNADVVRFDAGANTATTTGAIKTVNGVRILTLGLNAPRSSNLSAALKAVRVLRPDPSLTQVELLEATGNSFYHGGIFSVRYRLGRRVHFRAAYTLAKFIDEGTTNTASPQDLQDRRAERALSLQDQRHRFVCSGQLQIPKLNLDLAPIVAFGSSRPFNIGAGFDRNLNDIENDRPNFLTAIGRPLWRKPNSELADAVKNALALAPIGASGNLPRNYGRGPGTFTFNLRVARTFALSERIKLRGAIDVFNVLNRTTFSFGSEFIDRDDKDFLIPRRTQRPRVLQLNLKLDF
ncbi:MAG: TonB-dependent receptor [Acidobacteria bacterium]|nr:TonB-dependent receptor [Acidobacteriota bacterium]